VGWAVVSVWDGQQAKAKKWLGRLRRGEGGTGRLGGREGQAGWAERAKREEVFGPDFKWAFPNKI
jgi:hypothetical protein